MTFDDVVYAIGLSVLVGLPSAALMWVALGWVLR